MSSDFAIIIYFLVGFFDNELSERVSSSQGEPNLGGKYRESVRSIHGNRMRFEAGHILSGKE